MSVELACPVCDRSQVEGNICPNCETDLSIYRMLVNLPLQTPIKIEEKQRIIPIWLPIGVAILFLLLGLGLGFAGNSIIAKQSLQNSHANVVSSVSIPQKDSDTTMTAVSEISKEIEPYSSYDEGFNYTIRQGDSLSLIAARFYGDRNSWFLISEANPAIQGKENVLKIGELLLIPNLKPNSLNS